MKKSTKNKLIVIGAFLLGLAIFAGVDLWAAKNDVDGDTLSEMTLYAAIGRAMVAFLVGVAMGVIGGHFFWPQVIEIEKKAEETEDES